MYPLCNHRHKYGRHILEGANKLLMDMRAAKGNSILLEYTFVCHTVVISKKLRES